MTTTRRTTAAAAAVAAAAAAAAVLLAGCGSGDGHRGTVTQSWTGVSPTGNSLDVGAIVAGIVTDDGDRSALTVLPATTGNTATAECTSDTVTLTVDDWIIAATQGDQSITVHNQTRGLSSTALDLTRPVPGTAESVAWHDDGRVDITAAADTPTDWNTEGTFVAAATITCPTD